MKKLISILTLTTCALSSPVWGDELSPEHTNADIQKLEEQIAAVENADPEADAIDTTQTGQPRKQVGQAASDGSSSGASNVGKYVLAGSAILIGIAALILVARHGGHHHHHHHGK